jgi:hypothetical protein
MAGAAAPFWPCAGGNRAVSQKRRDQRIEIARPVFSVEYT